MPAHGSFAAITKQEVWTQVGRDRLVGGLSLVLVAGAVTAAWSASLSSHGNPDPGGHRLSAIKTVAEALPADARVVLRQANEPRWDSCDGRPGTFGWDNVSSSVQFRTGTSAGKLIADADRALRAGGWHYANRLDSPLGPGVRWTQTVAGSAFATAMLTPGASGDGTSWYLTAEAPPQGRRVSGC